MNVLTTSDAERARRELLAREYPTATRGIRLVGAAKAVGEGRYQLVEHRRFKVADLFDADSSALIIHAQPDNYANIPDRYRPAPDEATLGTGDAGGRSVCGVIAR